MRNIPVLIATAGLLFTAATEANATLFAGSVSFTQGSGPVFEGPIGVNGHRAAVFSLDLTANQSYSYDFLSMYRADVSGSGTGSLTISFTSPVEQQFTLSAITSANIITGTRSQCSGSNCSLPPTSGGYSTLSVLYQGISYPCLCTNLSLADGSLVQVSLSLDPRIPGGTNTYALGDLELTFLDLADGTRTEVGVSEPASLALLVTAFGAVAVRNRSKRAADCRSTVR